MEEVAREPKIRFQIAVYLRPLTVRTIIEASANRATRIGQFPERSEMVPRVEVSTSCWPRRHLHPLIEIALLHSGTGCVPFLTNIEAAPNEAPVINDCPVLLLHH